MRDGIRCYPEYILIDDESPCDFPTNASETWSNDQIIKHIEEIVLKSSGRGYSEVEANPSIHLIQINLAYNAHNMTANLNDEQLIPYYNFDLQGVVNVDDLHNYTTFRAAFEAYLKLREKDLNSNLFESLMKNLDRIDISDIIFSDDIYKTIYNYDFEIYRSDVFTLEEIVTGVRDLVVFVPKDRDGNRVYNEGNIRTQRFSEFKGCITWCKNFLGKYSVEVIGSIKEN